MGSSFGARRSASWAFRLIAASLLLPAMASAQEPVTSFNLLNTRLEPGDTVWVTDAHGHKIKGRILELTLSSLVLDAGQPRVFGAGDVQAVRERGGKALGKAAFLGTLAGAGTGVVLAASDRSESMPGPPCAPAAEPMCRLPEAPGTGTSGDWWLVPVFAGVGAGVGAVVGAVLPGKMREVYLAPAGEPGAGPGVRLSITPVIAPRHKAVAVSFAF